MSKKQSVIYKHPLIYDAIMILLYGPSTYFSRFKSLAHKIPSNSRTLELCCGPARLKNYLEQGHYTGLDISPQFIEKGKRRGLDVRLFNLLQDELPKEDFDMVVMQAGLYQFIPHHEAIVEKMFMCSNRYVLIAEPIRNLAQTKNPLLKKISSKLTDPGTGNMPSRFNDESLTDFFRSYSSKLLETSLIPGGRERLFLFDKTL
ncbi:class I SAM-dependent methyltransferase [bacterium]|nr:class I SAM-dependent methyltransferase [bacterium]